MKYNKKRGNQMNFDKHKRFLIQFAYYGVIIALGYLFVKYLLRYVWPFIIGWLIASLFKKPIKYVTDKFNIKRGVVSTIILLIFYSAIVTLAVVLSIQLATWIINYASRSRSCTPRALSRRYIRLTMPFRNSLRIWILPWRTTSVRSSR